jgi:type IV pilus biogenesis protein CpaD/CtpE
MRTAIKLVLVGLLAASLAGCAARGWGKSQPTWADEAFKRDVGGEAASKE